MTHKNFIIFSNTAQKNGQTVRNLKQWTICCVLGIFFSPSKTLTSFTFVKIFVNIKFTKYQDYD